MSTPSVPSERTAALKRELWTEIDRRRDELARLCADGLRVPAENLPGTPAPSPTTTSAFSARPASGPTASSPGRPRRAWWPRCPAATARPRFTFNGHLDHFPADDHALWSFPPYGGEIRDGKILGRGVSDMRGGLTASLFACLLHSRAPGAARAGRSTS